MHITYKLLLDILRICEDVNQKYESTKAALSKADLWLEDIFHSIEFSKFDASSGYKYAKRIKDVRQKRREIKNEFELLQTLITHTTRIHNELIKVQQFLETKIKAQQNRKYHIKTLSLLDNQNLNIIS